jgi:hypothetical protein
MQTKNDLYLQSQSNKESVYISKDLEDVIDINSGYRTSRLITANVVTNSMVKNAEVTKLKNSVNEITIRISCDVSLVEDFINKEVVKIKVLNKEYSLEDNYCYSFKKKLDSYNIKIKIRGKENGV